MARYVDGFVLPVPKKNAKKYQKVAKLCGKVWIEHGALEYFECIADETKMLYPSNFPKRFKTKPGENVWFSYIVYKSRAHRDRVNKKVMSDPRIKMYHEELFDMKRMAYGGFKPMVSLKK